MTQKFTFGCGHPRTPENTSTGARQRCRACRRRSQKSAAARRKALYNGEHAQRRKVMLPLAIGKACVYCGGLMLEWMKLDLDHATNSITHARCNRSAGARYGNALRGLRQRYSTIYQGRGNR
jgi:hypothetical protein